MPHLKTKHLVHVCTFCNLPIYNIQALVYVLHKNTLVVFSRRKHIIPYQIIIHNGINFSIIYDNIFD